MVTTVLKNFYRRTSTTCLHLKFRIDIVFPFSWGDCNTQEKLKSIFMQIYFRVVGGGRGGGKHGVLQAIDLVHDIYVYVESANCSLQIHKFPRPHVSVFKSSLLVHKHRARIWIIWILSGSEFTLVPRTPLGILVSCIEKKKQTERGHTVHQGDRRKW